MAEFMMVEQKKHPVFGIYQFQVSQNRDEVIKNKKRIKAIEKI